MILSFQRIIAKTPLKESPMFFYIEDENRPKLYRSRWIADLVSLRARLSRSASLLRGDPDVLVAGIHVVRLSSIAQCGKLAASNRLFQGEPHSAIHRMEMMYCGSDRDRLG